MPQADPIEIRYSKALEQFYREAIVDLKERARQRLVSDGRRLTAEAQRARILERDLAEVMLNLNEKSARWIAENIPSAYVQGVRKSNASMREAGIRFTATGGAQIHQHALEVLIADMDDVLRAANEQIVRSFKAVVRRTQLSAALDKAVTKEVALGVSAGKTGREVSAAITNRLIDEFGDGPIRIGGRTFSADSYAAMVARTKTAEAASIGTMNRLAEEGLDLVVVSAHGADDACGYYEGRVFSMSGTSDKYPSVRELPNGGPPFHPTCRHHLLPSVEDLASKRDQERAEKPIPKGALGVGKSYAEVEKMKRRAA